MVHFGEFLKAYGQKVLPDISLFAGQKLMENAKKKVIFSNYQTMLKIFLKYKTTWLTNFWASTADLISVYGRFYTQAKFINSNDPS